MSHRVLLSFALLLVPLKADQSQLDGSRGLKRGVHVQGNRVSYGNFAVDKFHRLQVSVGSSNVVSSYRECALSCVNTSSCSSFNIASSPRLDGKYRCELLDEDKYSANPGQLVISQEYHHYSIKTPCSSFPCQNGAKCVPNYSENQYHCDCVPGYTGSYCETDIDECSSSPCLNGAMCVDQVNTYVCNCQPGYAGVRCETDINECSSNPCLNGAACIDHINGYVCSCQAGFVGVHCETNINECSSNPCSNGGACVDQVNGYVCSCLAGYGGARCQTNINECSSNPCLNGGTCVDQVNGYVCNCQAGYRGYQGVRCETPIWQDYTPQWCGDHNRQLIQFGGITEEQCKQQCSSCAAIEYWSGSFTGCFKCIDPNQRYSFTDTSDGGYPPHVFVKN